MKQRKKFFCVIAFLLLTSPIFSQAPNVKSLFKNVKTEICTPQMIGFADDEYKWLPDACYQSLVVSLKSKLGVSLSKNLVQKFSVESVITKNQFYNLEVRIINLSDSSILVSAKSKDYKYIGDIFIEQSAPREVASMLKNELERQLAPETKTKQKRAKEDFEHSYISNEFNLGAEYMMYMEWAGYNDKNIFSFAHGIAIHYDYRLYFPVSSIDNIGLGFNFDMGFPFGIRTNMDGQKNVLRMTNCGITNLVTEFSIGFAAKHLWARHFWFEWYVGPKIGVFNATYQIPNNGLPGESAQSSIYNMTVGIQGEILFTYYFSKWLGISVGVRLDYDFFSLAKAYFPDDYLYENVLVVRPTLSAKFRI